MRPLFFRGAEINLKFAKIGSYYVGDVATLYSTFVCSPENLHIFVNFFERKVQVKFSCLLYSFGIHIVAKEKVHPRASTNAQEQFQSDQNEYKITNTNPRYGKRRRQK